MVSEYETDWREKPSQGNLWLLIRKVSWQRRLPTFSERTSKLSRKIEFTAVKSFVWRCQFIDFVPHELFIIVPCSMRLFIGSKVTTGEQRLVAILRGSFCPGRAGDLPIAIEVRTYHNMMHVMGKEIWGFVMIFMICCYDSSALLNAMCHHV